MKNIQFKLIAIFTSFIIPQFLYAEVSVIVNTNNTNNFSKADIEYIFLNNSTQLEDGSVITPYTLKADDKTTLAFQKKVLNKNSARMKAHWSQVVFTGKGMPVQTLASSQAIIEKISSDANAIGVIDSDTLTDDVREIAKF